MSLLRRLPHNTIADFRISLGAAKLGFILWRAGTRIRAELRIRC